MRNQALASPPAAQFAAAVPLNAPHARRLIAHASLRDEERETRIYAAYKALINAADVAGQYAAWYVLRPLVLGRSPAEVARRERMLGLERRR